MHLGPTEGRIVKNKKKSAKRWDDIQQVDTATASSSANLVGLPLGTSEDRHQKTLAWVGISFNSLSTLFAHC
jgi:hypothetical protein